MHQQPDIYAGLNDTALSEYFRNAGDRLIDESAVMSLLSAASLSLRVTSATRRLFCG